MPLVLQSAAIAKNPETTLQLMLLVSAAVTADAEHASCACCCLDSKCPLQADAEL
jgi:hypothetical protein